MELTKFTKNVSNHQSQPDKPALTATQLKALFDKAPEDIKDYLNNTLLPELEEFLNKIPTSSDIVNDVTVGGENKVASAESVKELNNAKQNKISYGTSVPTSLEEGEIYLQIF